MLTQEICFSLKDGRNAILRNPQETDIEGMLDYLYVSAGETEFILRYPEECVKYTPDKEKALFDEFNASDHEAMLVCVVEGKVAGNCQIKWSTSRKIRHRAEIGIALLKEFWGQGIGTQMMRELIRIAEDTPGLTQIELDFVEGNTRARALYEKMGFRITGIHPDAFCLKDGTFLNEYSMIRKIER